MSCVFCCMPQRAIYGNLLVIADPPTDDAAGASLQAAFKTMWYSLYDDPALLGLNCIGDESYPWNVVNNQYPELDEKYKQIFKTVYEFWRFLQAISICGTLSFGNLFIERDVLKSQKVSYKPVYAALLEKAGFTAEKSKTGVSISHANAELTGAMQRLALSAIERAQKSDEAQNCLAKSQNLHDYIVRTRSLYDFIRCSFDGEWEYIIDRIDTEQSMGGILTALLNRCRESGYILSIHPECGATSTSGFGIDFMLGTGGFHITYNPRKTQKFGFGTKNGIGEKKMLENFDTLDDDMQQHFIDICRPCNQCLGCTKGGKNKLFTVNVSFNGAVHALCPQFPRHEWSEYTPGLIERLFKYHALQEKYS